MLHRSKLFSFCFPMIIRILIRGLCGDFSCNKLISFQPRFIATKTCIESLQESYMSAHNSRFHTYDISFAT